MKILHLIGMLFPLAAFAQWDVAAGYKYHMDFYPRAARSEADPYDKDDPYVQDMFLLDGRYTTKKHWQWGVGVSYLQNAQHFFYHDQSEYNDAGAGGSYSKISWKEYGADVHYGYAGLNFSISRWFMNKRKFQIGVGVSQHNDFLVFFEEGAKVSRTYEKFYMTTYQNGVPMYSTSYNETDWAKDEFPTYVMREHFGYVELELLLRYRFTGLYIESALSCAVASQSRMSTPPFYEFYNSGTSMPPWFEQSKFFMPGLSLRIGYRFGGKKTE